MKSQSVFVCTNCKAEYPKWQGQCVNCGEWNTLVEQTVELTKKGKPKTKADLSSVRISNISQHTKTTKSERLPTGLKEFDRVLGGGFVAGEVILLAGSPGIGKSTLLLQTANLFAKSHKSKVLYVAGEESASQISVRAKRLSIASENIDILEERDVDLVIEFVRKNSDEYGLIIIDSIQTIFTSELTSSAGSVSQVTECSDRVTSHAKSLGIPAILIGHITKEGSIAGPKTLEHLVDGVFELEGDKFHRFRLLRATKNRFGSVDEVGVFEMNDTGLVEVSNPSDLFINERQVAPGSVITVILEGTRPMLFEVQALATRSYFPNPRRTASGFDYNRLILLCAVLEKRLKLNLSTFDVYVNISGGAKINEPAADLAVCLAIASSLKNKSLSKDLAAFGEVGLLGEIRKVSFMDQRIKEATKLGFKDVVSPKTFIDLKAAVTNII